MTSRRSKILLLGAGCATALALAEGSLRLLGVAAPSFHRFDPLTGTTAVAGVEGIWRGEGRRHRVRINRRGLRDVEHALAKPAGSRRLLVVGDSFTEAMQVAREDTFWARLPALAAPCLPPGERLETIDFGVSGTGTAQQLLKLRHQGAWDYRPDLVVLAFFTGNDVANNSLALDQTPDRPYFTLVDGGLMLDDRFRRRWSGRWRASPVYSAWLAVRNRLRVLQLAGLTARRLRHAGRTRRQRQAGEIGLWNAIYAPPTSPAWREAWAVSEALIQAIARESRQHGARFLLVGVATAIQVHPDPAERRRFMTAIGVDDLGYPERRLIALGRRAGFPVLPLAAVFLRHATRTGDPLHGFTPHLGLGHWNERGHALAARSIAERLCAQPELLAADRGTGRGRLPDGTTAP